MSGLHRLALASLRESIAPVLADGLEQPVTRLGVRVIEGGKRLVTELAEQPKDVARSNLGAQ